MNKFASMLAIAGIALAVPAASALANRAGQYPAAGEAAVAQTAFATQALTRGARVENLASRYGAADQAQLASRAGAKDQAQLASRDGAKDQAQLASRDGAKDQAQLASRAGSADQKVASRAGGQDHSALATA